MSDISYISGKARSDSFPIPNFTILDKLKYQAETQPDREAFIIYNLTKSLQRDSITFSELYAKSKKFATSLKTLGIKKGDPVIVCLLNCIEWLVVEFGIMLVGAIPVNTYAVRQDGSDMEYVIKKTNSVAIVLRTAHPIMPWNICNVINKVSCTSVQHVISVDIMENEGIFISYRKLLEQTEGETTLGDVIIDPNDIAVIMRTSGTTGRPALISHSHITVIEQLQFKLKSINFKTFTPSLFSWMGGSPFAEIINGSAKVTIFSLRESMDIRDMLKIVEIESCYAMALSNDILGEMTVNELLIPESVRILLIGGSPVKERFVDVARSVRKIIIVYGTLESGHISEYVMKGGDKVYDNIAGTPLNGVEIKVINDDGEIVRRGEKGRVFARTPYKFISYVGDKDCMDNVVRSGNWMDTEDIGYITKDGILFILGRKGDRIEFGNISLHAAELENSFSDLLHVQNLAVIPIPDEILGQEICLCIIPNPNQKYTEARVMGILKEKIVCPAYIPKYIFFMESFPVNVNGKLDKKRLTEAALKLTSVKRGSDC